MPMTQKFDAQRALLAASVGLALGAFALPAHADATLDKIQQRHRVVVGVALSGLPFGTLDPVSRKPVGYHVELAQSVAKHLGVDVEIVSVNANNRVQFLQQGRVDLLIANMQFTEERSQILTYVPTPYDQIGGAGLVSKASGIKDWSDLRGKAACVSQGSNFTKPLIEQYGAQVKGLKDIPESTLALRGGNCAVSVHVGPTLYALTQQPEWKDYTLLPTQLIPSPSVIWVRQGETDTQQALDKIVRGWHQSGELLTISERNGVPTDAQRKLQDQYKGS